MPDRRRPGRPALDASDRSVSVCVCVPSRQYETLCKQAQAIRVSVPELLRRGVRERSADETQYLK